MSLRVTLDTGALADVVSPETSQRGMTGRMSGTNVRAAIEASAIQGFFCETLVTLEGIKKADREAVFGSTVVNASHQHETAPDGSGVSYINLCAEQPARRSLDQRQANRFLAAFNLGMKLLGAPRIAMARVDNPDGNRYVAESSEEELTERLTKYYDVASPVEARGLGCAQAQRTAREIHAEVGGNKSFLFYLGSPRNRAEQKRIKWAIAEWADGDSIAAHYGYGIDLFCTEDFGKNASEASVLGDESRAWLTQTFGIRFITLGQLAELMTTWPSMRS